MELTPSAIAFPLPITGNKTNEVSVIEDWMHKNPDRFARAIVVLSPDPRPNKLPNPHNERWFWHTLQANESDEEKLDAIGEHIAACSKHCITLVCVGGSGELNTSARFVLMCTNSYLEESTVDDPWCAFDCDTLSTTDQDTLRTWMAYTEERKGLEAKAREPCCGAHTDSIWHPFPESTRTDDAWCIGQMLVSCKAALFGTEEQCNEIDQCQSIERLIELDQAIVFPEDADDAEEQDMVWCNAYNRTLVDAKSLKDDRLSAHGTSKALPCCVADNNRLSAPYGTDSLYTAAASR